MITVTFDHKLTEQFESYGDVLKWISDELAATSTSENSDNRVKLELLTSEEVQLLADDQNGIWVDVLEENIYFDFVLYYGNLDFMYVIKNINSCAYADVLEYLEVCGISDLFDIVEN